MKKWYLLIILVFVLAQAVSAKGGKEDNLNIVAYVDLEKFSGEWLVAALIPTPIEKNIQRAVETYTFKEDGKIDIQYSYYKNRKPDKKKLMTQKGWIIDFQSQAHWKISPLWPFKFNYYIFELADDYSYTVIGTDTKNLLWIMVRRENFESFNLEAVIDSMTDRGYDRNKIQIIKH